MEGMVEADSRCDKIAEYVKRRELRYLESSYKTVMGFPDPFLVSSEQIKFANSNDDRLFLFWELRSLLIERLGRDLDEELAFLQQLPRYNDIRDKLNWRHRRWMLQKFGANAASKEIEITKKIIHEDANNSLAWSHRQWVLLVLGGDWEDELSFCAKILEQDIFNGYAWDQRYFVVSRSPTLGGLEAMRDKEIDYALEAIALKAENECAWMYLRLLCMDDLKSLIKNQRVEDMCVSVFKNEKQKYEGELFNAFVDDLIDKRGCVNALEMVLDLIRLGFKPREELRDAIRALCQSDSGFLDKARSVLRVAKSRRR